nr:MAG: ORF1 [Torque teno midi virus]
MPFWWNRRRKPWFGRFRRRRRRIWPRRRRRRRRVYKRRRAYYSTRRRRRRHYKVRRKKKRLILTQWQPESVRKCKIKGSGTICFGAEGTQFRCSTVYRDEWTNPKTPGGGGFGVELFTLKYLFSEYKAKFNIWTQSNEYRDLCRYLFCTFTFYRHPQTDFILWYDTQPPFTINKYTYMYMHPLLALQRRKKKLLLSTATNPKGKLTKKFRIRPPKQLINKWFFQEDFSNYGLVTIGATACNFRYPWLGCCNENLIITLYYIQPDFYKHSEWSQYHTQPYNPLGFTPSQHSQMSTTNWYFYKDGNTEKKWQMKPFNGTAPYYKSVGIDGGWFCPPVMRAYKVSTTETGQALGLTPCGVLRYNPALDTGKGNKVWLTPTLSGTYGVPKDEDLVMEDYPLYMIFFGYTSFLKQMKHDTINFQANMFVIQSPALKRVFGNDTHPWYPIVDKSFCYGKGPGMTDPITFTNQTWYPSVYSQRDSISSIVNCGPYTPKYNETKESTWQCNYFYNFHFKWGGSYPPDQEAEDPTTKGKYPVPDKLHETIQIADPVKQKYKEIFKTWDYRRGTLTKKALKRMYDNLSTDESLRSDSTGCSSRKKTRMLPVLQNPKKENKEIQECLLSLCEETTCPDQEKTPDLFKLIQQQHNQQQQLKYNILTLISDLKSKQRNLLHQTGFLG